jgi:hypothetical protein
VERLGKIKPKFNNGVIGRDVTPEELKLSKKELIGIEEKEVPRLTSEVPREPTIPVEADGTMLPSGSKEPKR